MRTFLKSWGPLLQVTYQGEPTYVLRLIKWQKCIRDYAIHVDQGVHRAL